MRFLSFSFFFIFSWVVRIEASVLPWEVSVSAWPARVWVVFWLSVMKSSSLFSSLVIKFSILSCWADMEFLRVGGCAFAASMLKCVMLAGTEGDPIEVGVVGLLLMRFGSAFNIEYSSIISIVRLTNSPFFKSLVLSA